MVLRLFSAVSFLPMMFNALTIDVDSAIVGFFLFSLSCLLRFLATETFTIPGIENAVLGLF